MAIYVDSYRKLAKVGKLTCRWSHLFTCPDNDSELHKFAKGIGLLRSWFQPGRWPHYDVSDSMRAKAIKNGAIEIGTQEGMKLRLKEKGRL